MNVAHFDMYLVWKSIFLSQVMAFFVSGRLLYQLFLLLLQLFDCRIDSLQCFLKVYWVDGFSFIQSSLDHSLLFSHHFRWSHGDTDTISAWVHAAIMLCWFESLYFNGAELLRCTNLKSTIKVFSLINFRIVKRAMTIVTTISLASISCRFLAQSCSIPVNFEFLDAMLSLIKFLD